MKVLMLSSDKSLFQENSDATKRMKAYADLAEKTAVIVFNLHSNFSVKKYSDKLIIYPTNSFTKLFYFFNAYSLVKRIKAKENFTLIISQDPYSTGVIAWFLSVVFKIKLLISIFGNDIFNQFWLKENIFRPFLKFFSGMILSKADAIQSDNLETVEFLKNKYGNKVFWKPIIPSAIEDYRDVLRNPSEFFRILTVIRLVKQKNLPMLLDIIEGLFRSSVAGKIKFTLIGYGPLDNYVEQELEKRNLAVKVRWIRGCEWQELINYYKNADLFILTSLYEGFPRVFQEAMAVGLPIVTTPVTSGLVKDGFNGFVLPHNDSDLFVDKIIYLINNPKKLNEFSDNSREYFWQNFSFEVTLKAQQEIYKYLGN